MVGEAIEQIVQVGGCKTKAIARCYVEPSAKRWRARDYSAANKAPPSRHLSKPTLPHAFAVRTGPRDFVKTD